jgi:methylase of polypeptide subunit release factors
MTTTYYKLTPEQIIEEIIQSKEIQQVHINGDEYLVFPNVYPSDRFRTTNFILDSIERMLQGATLCDMGCGMGIIGLFAMHHGAKHIVQVDVSPLAVENAKVNRDLHHLSADQIGILESNCFDNVPKQAFDIIVFNIPFHSQPYQIVHPLEYAFHDPNFISTKKFLAQALDYCHQCTKLFIAFSSKGDVQGLEEIFSKSDFKWQLWAKKNTDQEYDNRLYQLSIKNHLV